MDKKSISEANDLIRAQRRLSDLRRIIAVPYPRMFSKRKRDQETGFCYDGDYVSFANLDDTTGEKIKAAILSVIDERYSEIEDEIKRL